MRGIFFPMVLLIACIALGAGFLILRPQALWGPAAAAFAAITGTTAKTETPTPAEPPKPVEKVRRVRTGVRPADSTDEDREVTVKIIALPPTAPLPFPLAQEVARGMTRSAVLAGFTAPTATIAGADIGHLQERLVYVDPPSGRATWIYLVDGKVSRAETFSP